MTPGPDIRRLRGRIELLEEANRQLLDALAPRMSFAPLGLSRSEGVVVAALIARRPSVVSKDQLFQALYALRNNVPDIKIVDVVICNARKKLRAFGVKIATHWGIGYAMDRANVEMLEEALRACAAGEPFPPRNIAHAVKRVGVSAPVVPTSVDIRIVRGYAAVGRRSGWISAMTGLEKSVVETILRAS